MFGPLTFGPSRAGPWRAHWPLADFTSATRAFSIGSSSRSLQNFCRQSFLPAKLCSRYKYVASFKLASELSGFVLRIQFQLQISRCVVLIVSFLPRFFFCFVFFVYFDVRKRNCALLLLVYLIIKLLFGIWFVIVILLWLSVVNLANFFLLFMC